MGLALNLVFPQDSESLKSIHDFSHPSTPFNLMNDFQPSQPLLDPAPPAAQPRSSVVDPTAGGGAVRLTRRPRPATATPCGGPAALPRDPGDGSQRVRVGGAAVWRV